MTRQIGFLQEPEKNIEIDTAIILVHQKEGSERFCFTSCSSEKLALKSMVDKKVVRIYRMYPDGQTEMLNIAMTAGKLKFTEVE